MWVFSLGDKLSLFNFIDFIEEYRVAKVIMSGTENTTTTNSSLTTSNSQVESANTKPTSQGNHQQEKSTNTTSANMALKNDNNTKTTSSSVQEMPCTMTTNVNSNNSLIVTVSGVSTTLDPASLEAALKTSAASFDSNSGESLTNATSIDLGSSTEKASVKFAVLIGLIQVGQVSNKDVVNTVLQLVSKNLCYLSIHYLVVVLQLMVSHLPHDLFTFWNPLVVTLITHIINTAINVQVPAIICSEQTIYQRELV